MIIIRIAGSLTGIPEEHQVAARGRAAVDGSLRSSMTVGQITLREERSRTVKASERVAQDIVRDIVRRGLETGDRLPLEAAMVEEYGVSRTSLREALRLLEMQGLISLKPGPGGGPVVGTVEPSHLARTAALYFHLGAATYDDLMRAQVLMESSCARLAARNPEREDAHGAVAGARSCPTTPPAYRDLTDRLPRRRLPGRPPTRCSASSPRPSRTSSPSTSSGTMDPVELRGAIIDEHAELAPVIASGDADGAEKMMAAHFEHQHDHLRRRSPGRIEETIQWR